MGPYFRIHGCSLNKVRCTVELGVREQFGFKTAKAWVELFKDKLPVRKLLQDKGSNAGPMREYRLETSDLMKLLSVHLLFFY